MKPKAAIVRGTFLNAYEMQFFEPLIDRFDITAFGSMRSYHDTFAFPVKKLLSPMDLPEFPKKMAILNRLFIDAQYLFGLEVALKGFDLVHTAETYYHYTQQCLSAKRKGWVKRVIATVLENIPFNNEGIWGRKRFKKRSYQELDHIIALTERTKIALLLEGVDEQNITVIPHFIDITRFAPAKKREKNDRSIRILFCGRLEGYKGVYELLYAFSLLLKTYDITLTLVGEGSQKRGLQTMARRLGVEHRVFYETASYEDMPTVYANADIYVAPSKETQTWQEQYNTTLLEAQASGLPIVTTYSGGIPENVGDAALFAHPGDAYSLVQQLRRLLDDPTLRETYGKKARARAERYHDKMIGAKKIEEVWSKFL